MMRVFVKKCSNDVADVAKRRKRQSGGFHTAPFNLLRHFQISRYGSGIFENDIWRHDMRLSIEKCANLVAGSYAAVKHKNPVKTVPGVVEYLDNKGAQALMLDHKVLVIPGSNEVIDWIRNVNVYNILGKKYKAKSQAKSKTGAILHTGFNRHADLISKFAMEHDAKFIIGHSLGAATAQILGSWMGVPAVGFASPRVKLGARKVQNESKILNICRLDDLVTHVPPSEVGFRRLGKTVQLVAPKANPGLDHSMPNYIKALGYDTLGTKLPRTWG